MYAVRVKQTYNYFYGWDGRYKIPRPKISQNRIQLRGFTDRKDAERVLKELGAGFEIVELRVRSL